MAFGYFVVIVAVVEDFALGEIWKANKREHFTNRKRTSERVRNAKRKKKKKYRDTWR